MRRGNNRRDKTIKMGNSGGDNGTKGENTERIEGDTNGSDVIGKVTEFRNPAGWYCSEKALI